jgi:hypothetical protein
MDTIKYIADGVQCSMAVGEDEFRRGVAVMLPIVAFMAEMTS